MTEAPRNPEPSRRMANKPPKAIEEKNGLFIRTVRFIMPGIALLPVSGIGLQVPGALAFQQVHDLPLIA